MTIHRIHHNDDYLIYQISTREVLDKLGREHPFHIDRSPISYADIWSTPLQITFVPIEDSTKPVIPDISESDGRLFLNIKAYQTLKPLIENDGEFLPVVYEDGEGFIFNPLTVAEDLDALNTSLTSHDKNGHLRHFEFFEDKLQNTAVFRAKVDHYAGLFCGEAIKEAIEGSNLTGVYFQPDLANWSGKLYPQNH